MLPVPPHCRSRGADGRAPEPKSEGEVRPCIAVSDGLVEVGTDPVCGRPTDVAGTPGLQAPQLNQRDNPRGTFPGDCIREPHLHPLSRYASLPLCPPRWEFVEGYGEAAGQEHSRTPLHMPRRHAKASFLPHAAEPNRDLSMTPANRPPRVASLLSPARGGTHEGQKNGP
jgi:hypothetical protein